MDQGRGRGRGGGSAGGGAHLGPLSLAADELHHPFGLEFPILTPVFHDNGIVLRANHKNMLKADEIARVLNHADHLITAG